MDFRIRLKKHTKIYLDYFDYDVSDFIPCEVLFQEGGGCQHNLVYLPYEDVSRM